MAGETLGEVLRRIGRRAGLDGVLALTDAQLLERFADSRDEPAFAALMVRHGPMVLGVCSRLLHDAGQAEDAFQAAFLVLARKAGAIQRRPLLSAWLYGVAYKVAARLRGRAWRRQRREKPADFDAVPAATGADSSDYPALHEEVQRLPDKYRNPVVLCYLEGKTHDEAARLLRWPIGTVKGRLARARDLLRARLARRGVGPGDDAWRIALAGVPAPAGLVDATVRAAPLFAVGDATTGGLISARAVALSQGVLRTMMLTNWKIAAALALAAALLAGTGNYVYQTAAGEPGPAPKPAATADKPSATDKPRDDKDAIQGTWQVTAVETGGKDVSAEPDFKNLVHIKWTFTADRLTVHTGGPDDAPSTYKIDPTKKPRELDVTPLAGPPNEKGKVVPAIYSLEGDVLKICTPTVQDPTRPTELATKAGGTALLITFKREKADKDKPADKPKEDKEALQGAWRVETVEVGGQAATGRYAEEKGAEWVVKDRAVEFRPKKADLVGRSTWYRLNAEKTPKEIDFIPIVVGLIRPGEDDPTRGIYSLDGDVWTVALAGATDLANPPPAANERPKQLATKEGDYTILYTLKRVK